ncbi:N-acetylglucosaminyldiphosphodolichol N-acetylglucosaminyltransferase catalytic subunit alg13 [Emydomyces testavorans]|uniref:UDP-N-acetylglucosamine transferase subunit ALG13 n=1 Tax=Emydomyces testavorans TaxID=2070801 RepID=A0AAF0DG53_9EURO|nr:N-acetylglucosaminyldiphosphodolichol N-acetylglucosaminyltransferase catalytic subunit alg13 [Emydomyces testavorans]
MRRAPDIFQQSSWELDPTKYISDDPGCPVKVCFVTVGATASFNSLVREVLSQPFLAALQKHNYTHLLIQFGQLGYEVFDEFNREHGPVIKEKFGLSIEGFDYNVDGLKQEMMAVKANPGLYRDEGMIISHAAFVTSKGSGTILEAMRFGVPLVVVPNPELLHNHQVELAHQLSSVGYVMHGKLGSLASMVAETENFRTRLHSWSPAPSSEGKSDRGLAGVMEDELGFVD